MANIRIERVPIEKFYLGYLGFDHLQLALEQDSLTETPIPQEGWFVMEGLRMETPDGLVLGVYGHTGTMTMAQANSGLTGDALVGAIGTPETRGSHIIPVASPFATWLQMAQYASGIRDQAYEYVAYGGRGSLIPTLNSSSFIASALYAGGIDVISNLPHNLRFSPGLETLLGGNGDDHLQIHAQFNALFGGLGDDLLQGTDDPFAIDRLYGGGDNDLISWSHGKNYLHGGDGSWFYKDDGYDTVNYSGTGGVHIDAVAGSVEHLTPQYIAVHTTGVDYLMSIERLIWNEATNDIITTGPNVDLFEIPLSLYLGGEGAGTGPTQGDKIDFKESSTGLTINRATNTALWVTAEGNTGEGGLWIDSAEWVVGSAQVDKIYANAGLRGIESGEGDDFIDARAIEAFSGASPQGYDVEIDGGAGSDTIVSNSGKSYISGGDGADVFVISGMTSGESTTEVIIENADSADKLYIPYNYFNESGEGYEGSQLMQLTGGLGSYEEMTGEGWPSYFETRYQEDIWTGTDEIAGVIDFAGSIQYSIEGADLIISIVQGERVTETVVIDDAGNTETRHSNILIMETETLVRVIDFQPGDLGLQFIDFGDPIEITIEGNPYPGFSNWNAGVDELNPDMIDPFPDAPTAPASDPNDPANAPPTPAREHGTDGDDLIALNAPSYVIAGAGNDQISSEGDHNDTFDGGTGADVMAAAGGNDRYFVDNSGDLVIEAADAGTDSVSASIDYALSANVENLQLQDGATSGTGNALANKISGNAANNTLAGLDGNDTLAGSLGDDLLIGGEGSDVYSYVRGDGNDTIVESGTGLNDVDMLRLFIDITPEDITAYRLTAQSDDLILAVRGSGQITIADAFTGAAIPIEEIAFDSGLVWSTDDILALAQSATLVDGAPPVARDDDGLVYGGGDNILQADALLANDADPAGGALTIQSVSDVSIGTASVTAEGNIALDLPPGYEGPVRLRYTVVNAAGATAAALAEVTIVANAAPVLAMTLADQSVNADEPFTFALPTGLFDDPNGDLLSYFATLGDGSELPSWLTFNRAAMTFTGTPPAGSSGSLQIRVEAYDGFTVSETAFNLDIGGAAPDPNQTIAGTSGDDTLTGGSGNDTFTLLGNGTGFDTFDGGAGADTIQGSPWNDTLGLANVAGNLAGIEAIEMGGGNDKIALTSGDDTLDLTNIAVTGVELIDAGAGNDTVTGSAGNDTIRGNAGDDVLAGGAGDDTFTILGNPEGFDTFDGGTGTDTILGSAWNDTLGLANVAGNLTGIEAIDMGGGTDKIALTSGDDSLDLSAIAVTGVELIDAGAGNDNVTGSAGNDTIRGNAGDDVLAGGAGDDTFTIVGNAEGADTITGGAGHDTIQGSAWNDTLGLTNAAGNLAGIEAIDMGGGTDKIVLSAGDDIIDFSGIALTGVELIDAGAGNDVITASAANDVLKGGSGNDTFIFETGLFGAGFGHDMVLDFAIGTGTAHDVIDLSDAGFADFNALVAATSEVNGATVISVGTSQSVSLANVSLAQLTQDHFIL